MTVLSIFAHSSIFHPRLSLQLSRSRPGHSHLDPWEAHPETAQGVLVLRVIGRGSVIEMATVVVLVLGKVNLVTRVVLHPSFSLRSGELVVGLDLAEVVVVTVLVLHHHLSSSVGDQPSSRGSVKICSLMTHLQIHFLPTNLSSLLCGEVKFYLFHFDITVKIQKTKFSICFIVCNMHVKCIEELTDMSDA